MNGTQVALRIEGMNSVEKTAADVIHALSQESQLLETDPAEVRLSTHLSDVLLGSFSACHDRLNPQPKAVIRLRVPCFY